MDRNRASILSQEIQDKLNKRASTSGERDSYTSSSIASRQSIYSSGGYGSAGSTGMRSSAAALPPVPVPVFKRKGVDITMSGDIVGKMYLQLGKDLYECGEQLTGKVTIELSRPITIEGAILKLKGFEMVEWEEMRLGTEADQREKILISERNTFFSTVTTMFGPTTLNAGKHSYPIRFTLPQNLPANFHTEFRNFGNPARARVVYKAKAVLTGDWVHGTTQQKEVFKVTEPIHINEPFERIGRPLVGANHKVLSSGGSIAIKVMLDQNIYFTGDSIFMRAEILNESPKELPNITVRLYRQLTATAQGKTITKREFIHKEVCDKVNPATKDSRSIRFQIPQGTQSTCTGKLVKAKYLLQLEAESEDLDIAVPLLIVPRQPIQIEHRQSVIADNTYTKRKSLRFSTAASVPDQSADYHETTPLVLKDDSALTRCCCGCQIQ